MAGFHRLADELAAHLRDSIITGTIAAGETLAEASLAAEYDVARPTARTAIDILVLDGLVSKRPHMPAIVADVREEEISEILGLLEASEKLALDKLLSSDPDARPLRKMHSASTYALLDKLVEIADSERLHQVHRRSTFEFLLAQLHHSASFVDDEEFRVTLVDSILTLDYEGARSALSDIQRLRAQSISPVVNIS